MTNFVYDQYIYGNNDANFLDGGAANDAIYGLGGQDWLDGGPGVNLLDGGDGLDLAVFQGSVEDLNFVYDQDGMWTVTPWTSDEARTQEAADPHS